MKVYRELTQAYDDKTVNVYLSEIKGRDLCCCIELSRKEAWICWGHPVRDLINRYWVLACELMLMM